MTTDETLTSARAGLLRAIERLRVGLPPLGVVRRSSVGTEQATKAFAHLLDREDNVAIFMLGDYGTGKSHALTLLRELALAEGYATCWLTADGYGCALNHPQRFLANLLGTLETPYGDAGYAGMITRLLATDRLHDRVIKTVASVLEGGSRCEQEILGVLTDLSSATKELADGEEAHLQSDALVRLISGETLTGATSLITHRRMAYRLLELAELLATLAGCRGLLIIVDEVESVFTKLSNYRSRFGAYRTLSALCVGMGQANVKVAMAVTPDASSLIGFELRQYGDHIGLPPRESTGKFRRAIEQGDIPILRCEALDMGQLDQLLRQIRMIYLEAYPETPPDVGTEWTKTVQSILSRRPPIRIAVRDCIGALDRLRFAFSTAEIRLSPGIGPK
jgi:hypothetical protein